VIGEVARVPPLYVVGVESTVTAIEETATASLLVEVRPVRPAAAATFTAAVVTPLAALQNTISGLARLLPAPLIDRYVLVGAFSDTLTVTTEVFPPVGVKVMMSVPAARQPLGSLKVQTVPPPVVATAVLEGAVTVSAGFELCVTATLVAAVPPAGSVMVTVNVLTVVVAPALQVSAVPLEYVGVATKAAPCKAPAPIINASSTSNTLTR